jgi:hypothetical protein
MMQILFRGRKTLIQQKITIMMPNFFSQVLRVEGGVAARVKIYVFVCSDHLNTHQERSEGAFPPSRFCKKLNDKLSHKVASVSSRLTNLVCYELLTKEHNKNVRHLFVSLSASFFNKCDCGNAPLDLLCCVFR